MEDERLRLEKIVKNGVSGADGRGKDIRLSDIGLGLLRTGVVLSMRSDESSGYAPAFKYLAETARKVINGEGYEPHSLPGGASVDLIVNLFAEHNSTPQIIAKKKQPEKEDEKVYVTALAKLAYAQY